MNLKPSKCVFFQPEVEFLGRMVSSNMIAMADKDIQTVASWPVSTCTNDVERFWGFVNYHRTIVCDFAEVAQPLYGLTGENKFQWGPCQQASFEKLKKVSSP